MIDDFVIFPLAGALVSSAVKIDIDIDYRFLVCGIYLSFYRIQEDDVYIDRALYGRRDYLAILLGNLPQDETRGPLF